jgi:hypothetical protein
MSSLLSELPIFSLRYNAANEVLTSLCSHVSLHFSSSVSARNEISRNARNDISQNAFRSRYIICNGNGEVLRRGPQMDPQKAESYALNCQNLALLARNAVRDLDPKVLIFRLREGGK